MGPPCDTDPRRAMHGLEHIEAAAKDTCPRCGGAKDDPGHEFCFYCRTWFEGKGEDGDYRPGPEPGGVPGLSWDI